MVNMIAVVRYSDGLGKELQIKTQAQVRGQYGFMQNIAYTYDKVGNILTRSENGVMMSGGKVRRIDHRYEYDTLYRLTGAEGTIKEGDTISLSCNESKKVFNKFNVYITKSDLKKVKIFSIVDIKQDNISYDYCGDLCFENIIVIHIEK